MTDIIGMSNGFRAWGVTALLFALPQIKAFLCYATRRACSQCAGKPKLRCTWHFLAAMWRAGNETNMHVNAWLPMGTLFFAGGAGGAIFLASNFLGGYGGTALVAIMMPMWGMLATAAWGVTIQTASEKQKSSLPVAAGILLLPVMAISLSLGGNA